MSLAYLSLTVRLRPINDFAHFVQNQSERQIRHIFLILKHSSLFSII
ncbi:hypothetical protein HMPREF3293_00938 [Christensenella minuta]|uniref:Uncharacterized protein n=1 Tax=Christensenella minuta TaxID=626937 RepID=A0A136Q6D9_9FIRM|nr:hypothetical protein HMPREF3293_00938 [Christensenella minuta]